MHYAWCQARFIRRDRNKNLEEVYRQTYFVIRTLVGNKIVDRRDVVGASPVSAAPTTSSFAT